MVGNLMLHLPKKAIDALLNCGLLLDDWYFPEPHWFVTERTKAGAGFGRESLETSTLSRGSKEVVLGVVAECQAYAFPLLLTVISAAFLLKLH